MATAHIATILALTLTGFLPSSCTKSSATKKPGAPVVAAVASSGTTNSDSTALSKNKDLGVLNLTNHFETTIDLGAGKSCRITPQMLDRNDLQLTVTLETKQADGQTAGLNVTQVIAHPGKTFDVSIGETELTLTPNLVE